MERWILVISENVGLALLLFLDIGFDHSSSLGLDYANFLQLIALYTVLLIVGVVVSCKKRDLVLIAIQLLIPFSAFSVMFFLYAST